MSEIIDVLLRDIQLQELLFEDDHVIASCSLSDQARAWLMVSIPELFGQIQDAKGADRIYCIEGSVDQADLPLTFLLVDAEFLEEKYFERILSQTGPNIENSNPEIRYLREDVTLDELMADDSVILWAIENSEKDVEKTLTLFDHYKPRRPTRETLRTYRIVRHGAYEDRQTPHRDWEKETVPMDALVFILVDEEQFEWEQFFKPDPRDEEHTWAWGDFPVDMRVQEGVVFYFKGKAFGIGSRYQHLQHDGVVLDMAEIDLNGKILYYHTRPGPNTTWQLTQGGDGTPMEFHEIYPQICLFDHERKHLEPEK